MTGMPRRLLVDISHTLGTPHYTGIQRYVRHTLRQAMALDQQARLGGVAPAVPSVGAIAADDQGRWRSVRVLPAHPLEGLPPLRLPALDEPGVGDVLAQHGTHVLLADRFWHTHAWRALDTLLASPATITLVVYDLISLRHPEWFAAGVGERFARYLHRVLPHVRQVVCLSGQVRQDLRGWMAAEGLAPVPILVVAPGHQVWSPGWRNHPEAVHVNPPEGLPPSWLEGRERFVLQVGTLEPRKNHLLSWQAMQHLWSDGRTEGLLVIGQPGWLTGDFCRTLREAAAATRETAGQGRAPRVVWLAECTDAELDWCYRHAAAVLYPSSSEGYGLPLAEAAALGTPVVASDTAVHREVAAQAGGAICWTALHPAAMAATVQYVLDAARPAPPPHAPRSWALATRELVAAMGPGDASQPGGVIPGLWA